MELESILLPGIEAKRPIVIAGPCSAESEEQVMDRFRRNRCRGSCLVERSEEGNRNVCFY